MNDWSRLKFHDDKYVNKVEERLILGEKIAGKDLTLMVFNELFPCLALPVFGLSNHISSNSDRAMFNAKLDFRLLAY